MTMVSGRVLAVVACVGLLAAGPADAWSVKGHMVVAHVAYQRLDPTVRTRANALLRLNPYYKRWRAAIPAAVKPADRSLAVFMLAATWPDQIKSDPAYRDDGTHGGNVPDGPSSSQNTGYSDRLKHKYWHFVDIPFTTQSLPLPPLQEPNARSRITVFLDTLRSNAPNTLKSYDLTWLLHIVGDVHQPLHAVTRITKGDLDGDDGGNGVKTCGNQGCTRRPSLHSVWDGLLGTSEDIPLAIATARNLPAPDPQRAGILDEEAWVEESFEMAKSDVYHLSVRAGLGPYRLSAGYVSEAKRLARQQAALAGARLAAVLNRDLR